MAVPILGDATKGAFQAEIPVYCMQLTRVTPNYWAIALRIVSGALLGNQSLREIIK
jgi:hypothetical protein